ncbi:MAG TPA: hypothetical protein VNH18_18970 [Bryobacteraceae bacterium]|nr:hypothetical protein [Bryobacteraceae bacterium]
MLTIAASFAVGFSDQSWCHAGPYYGEGETMPQACLDALSKCAVEFEERETEFMTFLGAPVVVERPDQIEMAVDRGARHVVSMNKRCCSVRR